MNELRQREPRVECPPFLAFLRLRPCRACGAPAPSQAAHLRGADLIFRKRETGGGEKPSDRWAIPLCALCHLDGPEALHKIGEKRFFARAGFDPFACAANLYDEFLGTKAGRAFALRAELLEVAGRPINLLKAVASPKRAFERPARLIRSANRWPPRGTRKINARRKP